jgi:triacylglycerol lipase
MDVYRVYTFGGPMVGNATAVQSFDRELEGKVYRFVHGPDIVPKLPTISLVDNAYGHCVQEVRVGVVQLAEAAAESVEGFFAQLAAGADKALDAVRLDKIWKQLMQSVSAHDIAKYRERIAAKMNEKA